MCVGGAVSLANNKVEVYKKNITMRVTVDSNAAENWLATLLGEALSGVEIHRASLPVGDVAFQGHDAKLVFERKSRDDFVGSIANQHWEEQRARMAPSTDDELPTFFALLAHGPMFDMSDRPVHPRTHITNRNARSSMMRTMYAYNIPVFWCSGECEVVDVLVLLYRELAKKGVEMFAKRRPDEFAVTGGKRKNAASGSVLTAALVCVNGLSRAKAEAIVKAYPTMRALLDASVKELAAVQVGERKLGPAVAARVKEVFH